jgi:hypothetical protein
VRWPFRSLAMRGNSTLQYNLNGPPRSIQGGHDVGYVSPADALSTGSISDLAENGFVRYARHPASSAALRTVGLSLPVMKMTGTEVPAAVRQYLNSMPDVDSAFASAR